VSSFALACEVVRPFRSNIGGLSRAVSMNLDGIKMMSETGVEKQVRNQRKAVPPTSTAMLEHCLVARVGAF
jgi:hypothetical protein